MKRVISIVLTVILLTALTACGSNAKAETAEPSETPAVTDEKEEAAESSAAAEQETESEEAAQVSAPEETVQETATTTEADASQAEAAQESEEPAAAAHSDVLVAYFSATGTTKGVAERIASITGGDLYEILAAEPYSAADLDYNDSSSRTTIEQNDKSVRPQIGSEEISLEGYTTVYLGFPIWWGEEPRILDTFVEKYSFDGITVIPFCTSGGSGIGRSGSNMESLAGSGTWLEGQRFNGNVSEEDLQAWIDSLK